MSSKQLKIKKCYIDSRYRTEDSKSDTDFKFDLKQSIDLPDNCHCYIDDIQIPHTWYSVENYNNKFYVQIFDQQTSTNHYFIVPLIPQNHNGISLAADLQQRLTYIFPTFGFTVVYSTSKGSLIITSVNNELFRFLSDRELRALPTSIRFKDTNNGGALVSINQSDLRSANSIIRNNNTSALAVAYTTPFIDLLNTHSIFIHSPNIGSFETLGVRGESTIIKKVPVSSSFGFLIIDSVVAQHDKIDVSKQMFKQLEFQLKNVHGNVIDLHGSSISFSLIFESYD